jgi:5-methylcytosine-specific restriction enzyme subunit McrC
VIRRSLFEWGSLPYGDAPEQIPVWAADRLARVAQSWSTRSEGSGKVIQLGRRALRAGQVVGMVAAEGCVLEILPKIDSAEADGAEGHARKRLVHMLAVAIDLDVRSGALSDHDWQNDTLLEVLISLFTRLLTDAVRQGMPRRYLSFTDDLPALRGKLDMVRQFSTLAASPQRLACQYDELSPDILLNRIMKSVVAHLARFARRLDNQRRLAELSLIYADISPLEQQAISWDGVSLDRTSARWKSVLAMARLILGKAYQTTTSGSREGFSLLFEMNTLFEQYVGRLIRRAAAGSGLTVHLQGGRLYCLHDADKRRALFQTRPDILIKRGSEVVHVIDTKWKRIGARIDDPKRGVSQGDVYQMMAYAQLYRCDSLVLLYPHHVDLTDPPGAIGNHVIQPGTSRLRTCTLELSSHAVVVEQLQSLLHSQAGSRLAG